MLLSLPVEILTEITCQSGLDPADHAHLASLHSALYQIVIPHLYKNDIQHGSSHCVFWAAKTGSLRTLTTALDYGADPNIVGPDETDTEDILQIYANVQRLYHRRNDWVNKEYGTPLHLAAKGGHDNVVTALLDAGANVHAVSRGLCYCRIHGTHGVELDFDLDEDEPTFPLPNWLPLHHAVCNGHVSTANLLLDRGAPLQMCYEPRGLPWLLPKLPSLVHCAAANGLETLVQRAIDTDIGTALRGQSDLDSPLHYACETWNSKGVIERLVSAGHNLNMTGCISREPPLFRALELNNYAAALHLLRAGARTRRVRLFARGRRPAMPLLHRAAAPIPTSGIVELLVPRAERELQQSIVIRTLIEDHGLDVDEPWMVNHPSGLYWNGDNKPALMLRPLHVALCHIKAKCRGYRIHGPTVKLLLELGANANKRDFGDDEPLTMALHNVFCRFGLWGVIGKEIIPDYMLEPVGLLIDAGARLLRENENQYDYMGFGTNTVRWVA